jgi:hypothetical protein
VFVETGLKGQDTLQEHRALLVAVMQDLTCLLAEIETPLWPEAQATVCGAESGKHVKLLTDADESIDIDEYYQFMLTMYCSQDASVNVSPLIKLVPATAPPPVTGSPSAVSLLRFCRLCST